MYHALSCVLQNHGMGIGTSRGLSSYEKGYGLLSRYFNGGRIKVLHRMMISLPRLRDLFTELVGLLFATVLLIPHRQMLLLQEIFN